MLSITYCPALGRRPPQASFSPCVVNAGRDGLSRSGEPQRPLLCKKHVGVFLTPVAPTGSGSMTGGLPSHALRRVVDRAQGLMSDEHFTVDGTLIEAWASQKNFQRKDGDADGDGRNFRGQQRKNDTPASKTDPDALYGTTMRRSWAVSLCDASSSAHRSTGSRDRKGKLVAEVIAVDRMSRTFDRHVEKALEHSKRARVRRCGKHQTDLRTD